MNASAELPRTEPADPAELIEWATSGHADRALDALAATPDEQRRAVVLTIGQTEGGLRALLAARARHLATRPDPGDPVVLALQAVMEHRFAAPALELHTVRIDSPSTMLDRIVETDDVNPMNDPEGLVRRLDPSDRRCFALVHPDLEDEPLIFVFVALTVGIETSVQTLLTEAAPGDVPAADTAMFYAIVKCEPGLRGIALGPELLHRSIAELTATTSVSTFCTLSPIPGFARWLENQEGAEPSRSTAARYLLSAKRGRDPLDPVARFHLGNGARLEQLNEQGNTSRTGLQLSLGFTVNYRYEPSDLPTNRAAYDAGEIVATRAVRSLVGQ
jgi:malonyl-CoA decarboxylase